MDTLKVITMGALAVAGVLFSICGLKIAWDAADKLAKLQGPAQWRKARRDLGTGIGLFVVGGVCLGLACAF